MKLVGQVFQLKAHSHVRSSHRRCSVRKGVLRNFAKFTGKHLCQNRFLNKVAGLRPATLLKKRHWHRCFPVNFMKFLRKPLLQNTSGRLLLSCLREFLAIESPLKKIKSAFYFTLKVLFLPKIFRFFLDFSVMQNRKIRLIPKFLTSQPG